MDKDPNQRLDVKVNEEESHPQLLGRDLDNNSSKNNNNVMVTIQQGIEEEFVRLKVSHSEPTSSSYDTFYK
eukprot:Pgem_evm1s19192